MESGGHINIFSCNGTARLKKCEQLFEYRQFTLI
jgi:hypothetical protein